ncbi:MAG: NHLP bacteriocin export ABC transporter permease/ATPase subunit [Acidobacteriota bacterium]
MATAGAPGRSLRLDGAQDALPLSGEPRAFRVTKGSLALFWIDDAEGGDHRRHLLFEREVGDWFLGLPEEGGAVGPRLWAIPLEPCEVEQRSLSELGRSLEGEGGAGRRRQVAELFAALEEALPEAELGLPSVEDPESWLPWPDSWAAACPRIAQALLARRRELERGEVSRLRALGRQASGSSQQADEQLVSVFRSKKQPPVLGAPLLSAATEVGRHAGLDIRPAAASEDLARVREPLDAVARASRLRLRKVLLEGRWWEDDGGPMVARLGEEDDARPVALLPDGPGRYALFDPETGQRQRVDDDLASELAAEAFVFYRPLPEKVTKAWELLRFAFGGFKSELVRLLLTAATVAILGMATPHALALLVDHVLPDADRSLLLWCCAGLLLIGVARTVVELTQRQLALRLELLSDSMTQAAVWDKLLKLSPAFFRRHATGDLLSRVNAVGQIRAELGGTTLQALLAGGFALLNFALLLYYSPPLSLLALGAAVITAVMTVGSGVIILRLSRELMEIGARVFGLAVELVDGVSKLRVAGAEDRAFTRWSREYAKQQRLVLKIQTLDDLVELVGIAVSTATTIALFYMATQLLVAGDLTPGRFLGFHAAFGAFVGGLVSVTGTITSLLEVAVLHERARPILEEPAEVASGRTDPGRLSGAFAMERVVFRYREGGPAILDEVDLHAEAGEMIGLVGPSGSGKSTIVRLLLGFEDPESGRVLHDGQDLSGLDLGAVRRQVGSVLQGGRINSGSLFDAISGGNAVELDEAWAAARAAGLAEDIEAMPMGLHTVVSEGGTNLSGGQRQRLFIARALVLQPRLLFLDEATSALDNRTQSIVTASIGKLDVTRLVIAHRLSTVRDADRIYVLDQGRVVQVGSFDELSATDGLFARLMKRQQG